MQRKFHSRGLKGINGYRHFQEQTIVGEGRKMTWEMKSQRHRQWCWGRRNEFYMWALGKQQLKGWSREITVLHFSYHPPLLPFKVSSSNVYTSLHCFQLCSQLCRTVKHWQCPLCHQLIQWAWSALTVLLHCSAWPCGLSTLPVLDGFPSLLYCYCLQASLQASFFHF